MGVRVEKLVAHRLAVMLAPECGETLAAFREKRDGWVRLPPELELARDKSGLGDTYVLTYEDELRIYSCLIRAIYPENTEETIKAVDAEFCQASPDEKLAFIDEVLGEVLGITPFELSDDEQEELRKSFESLPEEEMAAEIRKAQYILAYVLAYFHNTLSLMVHGQKLTTLVPRAMQGDKEAFAKAVQIDRSLLTGHPYFKSTYERLQTGEDKEFLDSVLYRIGNPTTKGKIRFPALYMVFATLDSFNWLDDFTAAEILDICDEAGLDRFQNQITDETNLNKRRAEYRRYQKLPK